MFEINGVIQKINDTQNVSDNFKKREVWLNFKTGKNEEYEQVCSFEFSQNKCEILDQYAEGEEVTITFDLRGRLWQKDAKSESKCFNTLSAWKIEKMTQNADSNGNSTQAETVADTEEEEDMPF